VPGRRFADAAARKDAGDAESHPFLLQELGRRHPTDAARSAEGVDDAVRLRTDRVGIVDPLEGGDRGGCRRPPHQPSGRLGPAPEPAGPWLPDLLVCRPELAEELLVALSGLPAT
jgi:hypothetical protein